MDQLTEAGREMQGAVSEGEEGVTQLRAELVSVKDGADIQKVLGVDVRLSDLTAS